MREELKSEGEIRLETLIKESLIDLLLMPELNGKELRNSGKDTNVKE